MAQFKDLKSKELRKIKIDCWMLLGLIRRVGRRNDGVRFSLFMDNV